MIYFTLYQVLWPLICCFGNEYITMLYVAHVIWSVVFFIMAVICCHKRKEGQSKSLRFHIEHYLLPLKWGHWLFCISTILYSVTSSSSFFVSSSIRRMSSIVRSHHLSIQQNNCLWKWVNSRFSTWTDRSGAREKETHFKKARSDSLVFSQPKAK